MKLIINTHNCMVKDCSPKQMTDLKELLSYPIAQSEYIRNFKIQKARKDKNLQDENYWKNKWSGKDVKLSGNTFPIGLMNRVQMWMYIEDRNFETIDNRKIPLKLDYKFNFIGKLYDFQDQIIKDTEFRDRGIYNIGTGGGKTILAIYLLCMRNVSTIIVVPSIELVNQWIKRLQDFTDIKSIGFYSRGQLKIGDVMISNSSSISKAIRGKSIKPKTLERYKIIRDIWRNAGMIIIDEVHKAGAETYVEIMGYTDAYYVIGLSATLDKRTDKKDIDYYATIGDKLKVIDHRVLEKLDKVVETRVWFWEVPYKYYHKGYKYHTKDNDGSIYFDYIIINDERNKIALDIVIDRAFKKQKQTLIMVKSVQHGKLFLEMLDDAVNFRSDLKYDGLQKNIDYAYIYGEIKHKDRRPILDRYINNQMKVLITQYQLLGEGWDVPSIEVIVILLGDKSAIQKLQNAGRGSRKFEGKAFLELHDFADNADKVRDHAIKRAMIYKENGYKFMNLEESFLYHHLNN